MIHYYTGSVTSYSDLLTVLVTYCTSHGWSYSGGILSKGAAFLALKLGGSGNAGEGLMVQGGTGQSGSTLLNPSPNHARIGRPSTGTVWDVVGWPATYHIHIGTDTNEVYVLLNTNITTYYYLAFGVSNHPGLTGTGLWLTGNVGEYPGGSGVQISHLGGTMDNSRSCCGPFWAATPTAWQYLSETMHIEPGVWSNSTSGQQIAGIEMLSPLVGLSPNNWNGESVLLPMRVFRRMGSNKYGLLADIVHARYVRLNNLEPGQIVTLGHEQWKVYPFYKKNSAAPDGGSNINHTGTFGWAIRYAEAP